MADMRIQPGYYFALNKANGMMIVVQWDEKAEAFWVTGDDKLYMQQDFFYEYLFCPERLTEPENRKFREFWRATA
jgi:hypothetical protein